MPRREVPREVPSGPSREDDDDYNYSKLEMEFDNDSDDASGNDAGMGFLGSIVPDEDDDVANTLLEQLGGVRVRAKPAGDPSLGEQLASYPAGRHSANALEQMELHKHNYGETPYGLATTTATAAATANAIAYGVLGRTGHL